MRIPPKTNKPIFPATYKSYSDNPPKCFLSDDETFCTLSSIDFFTVPPPGALNMKWGEAQEQQVNQQWS